MKSPNIISVSLLFTILVSMVISNYTSDTSETSKKYIFYLHGGVVQEYGVNAVSRVYGPYKYYDILDTLRSYGYNVISERRPKGTDEEEYAKKVSKQIDSLFKLEINAENIFVVGASQGAGIAIETAYIQRDDKINYALLAICNEYNMNYYAKYQDTLCGNFLSIYESTDQKKSCNKLLMIEYCKSGYKEIELNMGNGHGFIFKPYKEWIQPLVKWIDEND